MNEELLMKIDELIEDSESELINDTMDFIRIKSERGEPIPGAPFGIGPRMMLDEMLKRGDECGFFAVDYNVGVVSLNLFLVGVNISNLGSGKLNF